MDPQMPQPGQEFSPIRSYDKLDIAITQMLEGELSMKSAFALAFDPDKLTPKERTQLEDNLRKGEKGNSVAETALGIVTNPMAWLYFATGGPGANLATKGVGLFGRRSAGAIGGVAKRFGDMFGTMDLLSGSQFLYDYPALRQSMQKLIKGIQEMQDEYLSGVSEYAKRVEKSTGLYRGINPLEYPAGSVERKKAEKITRAIYAKSAGMHVTHPQRRLSSTETYRLREKISYQDEMGLERFEWGEWKDISAEEYNKKLKAKNDLMAKIDREKSENLNSPLAGVTVLPDYDVAKVSNITAIDDTMHRMLDGQKIDDYLKEFDGLPEWIEANQKAVRQRMIRLYGKEGIGTEKVILPDGKEIEQLRFEVDEDKSRKLFAGLHSDFWSGKKADANKYVDPSASEGGALLEKIVGPEAFGYYQTVPDGEELMLKKMKEVLEEPMQNPYYVPRKLIKHKEKIKDDRVVIRAEQHDFDNPTTSGGDLISTEGVVTPRVEKGLMYDHEDLDKLWEDFGAYDDKAAETAYENLRDASEAAQKIAFESQNRSIAFVDMDGGKVWDKFLKETGEVWAMHIQDAGRPLTAAVRAEPGSGYDTNLGGRVDDVPAFTPGTSRALQYRTPDIRGGLQRGPLSSTPKEMSVSDAMRHALAMTADDQVIGKVKSTLLPAITRRGVDNKHLIGLGQFTAAKQAMGWLAKTAPMQKLAESSQWGKQFVQRMQVLASEEFQGFGGAGIATGLAKYLYGTHLGANLGSVTLNLLQPMLLTGTALGFRNTLPAYVTALKEVGKYAELRASKYGSRLFLEPEERLGLIREAFEFADEIGIEGDMLEQIDKFLINRASRTKGVFEKYTVDLPLKMFEKSEWFARSVTSHAVKNQFKGAMKKGATRTVKARNAQGYWEDVQTPVRMYDDAGEKTEFFKDSVKRATETFNFVPDEMGTVMAFLPTGKNAFMGRFMANPLTRQFLSFGLRSFTGTMHTLPRLGGGTRTLFGGAGPEISNYWAVLGNDIVRGLGMSAIVYETGKGLIGADLSRSLFGSTLTDVGGFERMIQGDGGIPLPPAGDIPIQFMRSFMSGDMDLLGRTVSRVIPGGVSLNRLLGAAPDLGPASLLQRTHAGWDEPLEDGSIPIYDGGNRLISYQRPQDLILKGLGVDLGRGQIAGNVDGYLLKQRDVINQYRRRYGEMILQGEMARAKRIAAEFQRRFDIPLTITETQLSNITRSRAVPRTERVLDSIDKAVRPQMAGMVSNTQPFNVDPNAMLTQSTSRRRDPYREVPTGLTQEQVNQLQQMLQSQQQQGQGYTPFEGY